MCLLLHFSVCHLKNGRVKNSFNIGHSLNSEIVRSPHPFAYFRFLFTQHLGKVFLPKSLFDKNIVNPVDNLKREVDSPPDFRRYRLPTRFDDATSFHFV